MLEALVDAHVRQHGGAAARSLAALSSADSARAAFGQVGDTDVQASLGQFGRTPWSTAEVTTAPAPVSDRARRQAQRDERAAEREAEERAVLAFLDDKLLAAARPEGYEGGPGHAVTVRQPVEAALPFVDASFREQPLIEARLRTTMGKSFWYLGDPKIAAEQSQKSLELYARERGPDHPDTLRSMNGLANSYKDLGRKEEALDLCEKTLAKRKSVLGPDHPDTLESMSNLALAYQAIGRYADAARPGEETLALRKTVLGPHHVDTLRSINNLALSYFSLRRSDDARTLREQVLALCQTDLPPDHPLTLLCMNNPGVSYYEGRRLDEAFKLFEEVLARRKAKLGRPTPRPS